MNSIRTLDTPDIEGSVATPDDQDVQEELFETCRHLGWKPGDLLNKAFAVTYEEWLVRQPQ